MLTNPEEGVTLDKTTPLPVLIGFGSPDLKLLICLGGKEIKFPLTRCRPPSGERG